MYYHLAVFVSNSNAFPCQELVFDINQKGLLVIEKERVVFNYKRKDV